MWLGFRGGARRMAQGTSRMEMEDWLGGLDFKGGVSMANGKEEQLVDDG